MENQYTYNHNIAIANLSVNKKAGYKYPAFLLVIINLSGTFNVLLCYQKAWHSNYDRNRFGKNSFQNLITEKD